jgi:hypothetical protein
VRLFAFREAVALCAAEALEFGWVGWINWFFSVSSFVIDSDGTSVL